MKEIAEPDCGCPGAGGTCVSVSSQYADVSLPLKVKPYAIVKKVETDCCGEPAVAVRRTCEGGCAGCEITLTQFLCIRISVEYGAEAEAGDATVNCRHAPGGGLCR